MWPEVWKRWNASGCLFRADSIWQRHGVSRTQQRNACTSRSKVIVLFNCLAHLHPHNHATEQGSVWDLAALWELNYRWHTDKLLLFLHLTCKHVLEPIIPHYTTVSRQESNRYRTDLTFSSPVVRTTVCTINNATCARRLYLFMGSIWSQSNQRLFP